MATTDLPNLLVKLYEDQIKLLQSQIEVLKTGHFPVVEGSKSKGKEGKKKREKENKGPKRPPNAYNLFLMDTLKHMKEENRQVPPLEMMAVVSKQWNQLDAQAKNKYTQRASQLKSQAEGGEGAEGGGSQSQSQS
ncbi:DUF1074 domain-containing protein, partial [archaeon]